SLSRKRIWHRRFVCGPLAGAESLRRRIVLRDEVVPIGKPHGAVGTDHCGHRREPLFGAVDQAPSVPRDKSSTLFLENGLTDQMRGWFADDRDSIPILFRKRTG